MIPSNIRHMTFASACVEAAASDGPEFMVTSVDFSDVGIPAKCEIVRPVELHKLRGRAGNVSVDDQAWDVIEVQQMIRTITEASLRRPGGYAVRVMEDRR